MTMTSAKTGRYLKTNPPLSLLYSLEIRNAMQYTVYTTHACIQASKEESAVLLFKFSKTNSLQWDSVVSAVSNDTESCLSVHCMINFLSLLSSSK